MRNDGADHPLETKQLIAACSRWYSVAQVQHSFKIGGGLDSAATCRCGRAIGLHKEGWEMEHLDGAF